MPVAIGMLWAYEKEIRDQDNDHAQVIRLGTFPLSPHQLVRESSGRFGFIVSICIHFHSLARFVVEVLCERKEPDAGFLHRKIVKSWSSSSSFPSPSIDDDDSMSISFIVLWAIARHNTNSIYRSIHFSFDLPHQLMEINPLHIVRKIDGKQNDWNDNDGDYCCVCCDETSFADPFI